MIIMSGIIISTIISSWFKDVVMSIQAALVGKLHGAWPVPKLGTVSHKHTYNTQPKKALKWGDPVNILINKQ